MKNEAQKIDNQQGNGDLPCVSGSLPTDKEIETWATYECGGCSQESNDERIGLIRGAKWMRRQILKAQGNDR